MWNHLHQKETLTNNALNWRDYCSARNREVHLIRNTKRSFYWDSTTLKIVKTFGALFVVLHPPNVPNYQIIQPSMIRTIMIIMILPTFIMSTLPISFPWGPSITSVNTQLNEVARTVSTWADNNCHSTLLKINLYSIQLCRNAVLLPAQRSISR